MSVIARAWYYVTRKKSKTLIMFLILFGISTAMISGLAIKKATVDARNQVNSSINASFGLEVNIMNNMGAGDRGLGNISEESIKGVKGIDKVIKYNARMVGVAEYIGAKRVELANPKVQFDAEEEAFYKNLVEFNGSLDSSLDNKFISDVVKLKEGRHIKADDVQKVLIHEDFAKLNNLKLKDTLSIQTSAVDSMADPNNKKKVDLEIVGLFTGSNKESATHSGELLENTMMTDNETIKNLYGYNDKTAIYQDASFYVDNPKDLDEVMAKAKKLNIDWTKFEMHKSDTSFPALVGSLDSMDGLINMMMIGIIIVSGIILSLILAFWINGRIHETGVLLSLGISKINIIIQYIIELLLIAIIGFGLSYFSGQLVAQNIGNSLVQQASESSKTNLQNELGGMQLGADPDTSTVSKTLEKIDVTITLAEMANVWLLGGLIILVSVSISSIFIIRLKPKEILSKMS